MENRLSFGLIVVIVLIAQKTNVAEALLCQQTVNPCLNGGVCKVDTKIISQVTQYCVCPPGWEGDRCELNSNNWVLKHDFGERRDLIVGGDLIQWFELGQDGEVGFGRIKRNGYFNMTFNAVMDVNPKCVKFLYRAEMPGITLNAYFTTSGVVRYLWQSANVVPVYGEWTPVIFDYQPDRSGSSIFTIEGTSNSTSGTLDIDDIEIVDERTCKTVVF